MATRELRVVHFCEHLTERGSTRSQADWDAYWFVKACKGEGLGRQAQSTAFSMNGQRYLLSARNADDVIDWFGTWVLAWAAGGLGRHAEDRIAFVPIPSSTATRGAATAGRTALFAAAAARQFRFAYVHDVLRWDTRMTNTRQGGSRRQPHLFDHLIATKPFDDHDPVVLVDDIVTTGGHMAACAQFVWENSNARVLGGLAAARAVHARTNGPAFKERGIAIPVELEWWDPFVDDD